MHRSKNSAHSSADRTRSGTEFEFGRWKIIRHERMGGSARARAPGRPRWTRLEAPRSSLPDDRRTTHSDRGRSFWTVPRASRAPSRTTSQDVRPESARCRKRAERSPPASICPSRLAMPCCASEARRCSKSASARRSCLPDRREGSRRVSGTQTAGPLPPAGESFYAVSFGDDLVIRREATCLGSFSFSQGCSRSAGPSD